MENKENKPYTEELNSLEVNNNPAKDFVYFIYDLLKTGVVVFIIAFGLRYFVIQPFIVDGESMMPNFVNNEYILAEKVSYLNGQPRRGDVVIFRYPGKPSISYIKRVIGLPGEKVIIEDNQVKIINSTHPEGEVIKEDYLPSYTLTMPSESKKLESTLGEGEYFVMGDNRQHSSDSREWGKLPKQNIIGRAWLTILPFDKFGLQNRISYPDLSFFKKAQAKSD